VAKKKPDKQGPLAFEAHFAALYGTRWAGLRAALLAPSIPEEFQEALVKPYFLDRASVEAARQLGVTPGDDVLDLCAAPGGKSLVLALALGGDGSLVSNDRSPDRRGRLRRVLDEHLPEAYRSTVQVTGHDATRWGLVEQNRYDRILLDAPCSSERHVLQSAKHLELWTAHRSKALAMQAVALFCSALEALKPGGILLYSTCSISPEENEGVLRKMEIKRRGQWRLLGQNLTLPDEAEGQGPLFWAKIQKCDPENSSLG